MRQDQIQIGSDYRVKIGSRLATVTVTHKRPGQGRARFVCRTHDTRREVTATAARLRPLPGQEPAPRAYARRQPKEYRSTHTPVLVPPAAVPGMIGRVNAARLIESLSQRNRAAVARHLGGIHVAETFTAAYRRVRAALSRSVVIRSIPPAMRRGIAQAVAEIHAGNRATYRMVMRQPPFPTEEMIGRAILGTDSDRERLLRHADSLAAGR
jgi:hypothetical protein